MLSGFSIVLDFMPAWMPQPIVDAVASLSFWTHFISIRKGVIDLRDLLYFVTLVAPWLAANAIVLDMKKAD
jgi:ABC-2 type transport system permease protein